jgi:hypothetical protein
MCDTPVTFAAADDASVDLACAAISDRNTCPFCSSDTRLATGVLAEKKASQFALIAAAADPEAPDPEPDDDALWCELAPELGEPLLLQPAITSPAAAAITGAREIRRIGGWNRMVSVSLLRVILLAWCGRRAA